jgi:hypothetical protein
MFPLLLALAGVGEIFLVAGQSNSANHGGGKGVHFNARGLQRHGELWAEKVAPWIEAQLRSSPSP